MKKFMVASLVVVILASLILAGCASPAPAPAPSPSPALAPKPTASPTPAPSPKPTTAPTTPAAQKFNLSFTTYWPETSTQYKGTYKPILDAITQKSNGAITWTTYLGGALGGGDEIYDAVRTGKADMGSTGTGYTPGRFPLHDVFTLPGAWASSKEAAECGLAIFDRYLNKEFVGTQPLALQQTQTFFIYTSKKQIKAIEDMKGLKIRSVGGNATASVTALGGAPVLMPLGEVYLSLQTGVVDGAITGPSAMPGFKLDEVLKYVLKFPIAHGSNIMFFNQNSWAKVPADLQKIIATESRQFAYTEMDLFTQDDPKYTKILIDKGGAATTLSADEQKRWISTLKPVVDKWIADMKGKGQSIDEFLTIVREETKKRNVPFPY